MKSYILTSLIVFFAAATTWADQCAWLSKDQAQEAIAALAQAKEVKSFCEPCQTKIAEIIVIQKLTIRSVQGSSRSWEVLVNDRGIDAAYIYVDQSNLAQIIQCPTEGVPDSIPSKL